MADQPEYEDLRKVWNAAVDVFPALIVQAEDATDVARTVRFARAQNLPLAVRSRGQSPAGSGTVNGGVLLDLSKTKGVQPQPRDPPDTPGKRLDLGRGGEPDALARGLALTSGTVATVGVGGHRAHRDARRSSNFSDRLTPFDLAEDVQHLLFGVLFPYPLRLQRATEFATEVDRDLGSTLIRELPALEHVDHHQVMRAAR